MKWRAMAMVGTMSWRHARAGFPLIAAVMLIAMQWTLVAPLDVDSLDFRLSATELKRTDRWRYGYVRQYHGAMLVRTRPATDDPPVSLIRADDTIAPMMARELRLAPWKATLELVFYAGLYALCRFGLRRLPWSGPASGDTRVRWCARASLSTIVWITAALAPYLVFGYGEPLLSTRQGPDAISWSGLVPVTSPVTPAVSYGLAAGC